MYSMGSKVWFTDNYGDIEYASLSQKYIQGSLEVLQKSFFLHESLSIACGIPYDPSGKKELEKLSLEAAKDGISVIAIDKKVDKVAGVAFNKLHVNNGKPSFYEDFAKMFNSSSSRDLILFMNDADCRVNLFEIGKTNCILEVMFLAVLPEYQGKQIGTKLVEISYGIGKELYQGRNIKHPLLDGELQLDPKPGIVTATFTSNKSQRIGEKLSFTTAATIYYKDTIRNGKSFYDLLERKQEKSLVVYKML